MEHRQIDRLELHDLYLLMGKALRDLQYLELGLAQFLTLKLDVRTPGRVDAEEAERMLQVRLARTLGQAIGDAKQGAALDESFLTRLSELNQVRRWLVHRSVFENGDDLYEESARAGVMERVAEFSREALALHHAVATEVEKWVAAHGLDTQVPSAIAKYDLHALKTGAPRLISRLGRWIGRQDGK